MWKTNIKEGDVFHYLTVVKRVENAKNGHSRWLCKCKCGNETIVMSTHLTSGKIKSCGCWWQEGKHDYCKTHGYSNKEKLYGDWKGIKNRCYTPTHIRYKNYGGKGIRVCEEWKNDYLSFREWALHNGYEEGLTIDRIDVNGNYEPSNCRWITRKEQSYNKTNSHYITFNGQSKTIAEWAEITGINSHTIQARIKRLGWSVEKALSTPIH
jgi:hypothetical protein